MKFTDVLRLAFWHGLFFTVGSAFFVWLFSTPLFAGTIFFYRGIGLLLVTCLIMTIGVFLFHSSKAGRIFTIRDIILAIVVLFSVNMLFFTHVPVTADRSISVFLLGYMNTHQDKPQTADDLIRVFDTVYMSRYGAIAKRMDEQIASGNVKKEKVGYTLTLQGRRLMDLYMIVAKMYGLNTRIVAPR